MKQILIFVLVVCILLIAAFAVIGYVFFERSQNMQKIRQKDNKSRKSNTKDDLPDYQRGSYCQKPYLWLENNNRIQNLYVNNDGLKLHAYMIREEDCHKWVLICHGYGSDASRMGSYMDQYDFLGFNILAPDARAHGFSEGVYTTMGYNERKDIVLWLNRIVEMDPLAEIVLFGSSMGASTVMFTVGEKLPDNVKCAIEDCGYCSVWEEFKKECKTTYHLPALILYVCSFLSKIKVGCTLKEADVRPFLSKAEIPMLFIHGTKDLFVPYWMMEENFNACGSKKESLSIPDAGHCRSSYVAHDTYWLSITQFIGEYMN